MLKNKVDLEEDIMSCWSIIDDIRILQYGIFDSTDGMTEDEIANTLIGLEYLYEIKFKKLFSTFEKGLK